MTLTEQLLALSGVTVLIMFSPGPDMVIVTRNTLQGGRVGGLRTALGVLTGNLVHISYCLLGIGWLISESIVAFNVMKYLGAAYLVFLGLTSLRAAPPAGESVSVDVAPQQAWYRQGFLNNLLNPKGTLFYLGVFTVIITPETALYAQALLVACTLSISAAFWLLFIALLDSAAVRRRLDRAQRVISRVLGGVLILLGLRVALLER